VKAEIVAIGTEILLGEIVDTNGAWIAAQLPELGVDLYYKTVVGDNLERITDTFRRGWERSDMLIVTGGLGPTEDDMTREAIAALLGEEPTVDRELESHLRHLFESRGGKMPESNIKQAWLIPSARAIENPRGTAPGWWVEKNGKVIACMPGVPVEMEHMWRTKVRPELEARSANDVLVTRTLKTIGLGESAVDEMVRHLYNSPGIGVGTYARADGVQIRIGAKAPSKDAALDLIQPVEAQMRSILGNSLWGSDDDTLEGYIATEYSRRGLTLATMESCTGGLLTSVLTDAPGSSHYLRGGLVTYQPEQKVRAGVPATVIESHGIFSKETARAMALAAREALGTDVGAGITGVLGPDPEGEVPPGTVHVAVEGPTMRTNELTITMSQGRPAVKRRAVMMTLMLLRRALIEETN